MNEMSIKIICPRVVPKCYEIEPFYENNFFCLNSNII